MTKIVQLIKYTVLGIVAVLINSMQLSDLLNRITGFVFYVSVLVVAFLVIQIRYDRKKSREKIPKGYFHTKRSTKGTTLVEPGEKEISETHLERYKAQLAYKHIGKVGQSFLLEKKISIIGAGGLGCNVATLLARAGIGKIMIFDCEKVEKDDIEDCSLFNKRDLHKRKADCLAGKLQKVNSEINLIGHDVDIIESNIKIAESDLAIDCTSDINTKLEINKLAFRDNIPLLSLGISEDHGFALLIIDKSFCFNCLLKDKIPKPDRKLASNLLIYLASSIASTQAIKYLLDNKIKARLINFNCKEMDIEKRHAKKYKGCPVCGS